MNKDIYGRTETKARKLFGDAHVASTISLVDGIWVARFYVYPDAYEQRCGAWKPKIGYAALNRRGEAVNNGTRRDTVRLALYGEWK